MYFSFLLSFILPFSIAEGETVTVVSDTGSGWVEVAFGDAKGLVPKNYLSKFD